jgi:hypothetical protein
MPDQLAGATIFPPPSGATLLRVQADLAAAMANSGLPAETYDISRVVVYPAPNPNPTTYEAYAAPIRESFQEFPTNTYLGVYWDAANHCEYGSDVVYQVKFEGQKGAQDFRAVLVGKNKEGAEVTCVREAFYADQPTPISGTVMYFGQVNPCILCGCCDKGCGCLICWR